jgi:hypothetical protein
MTSSSTSSVRVLRSWADLLEVLEQEAPQLLEVAGPHQQQHVGLAGDQRGQLDVGQRLELLAQRLVLQAAAGPAGEQHERGDAGAEPFRVDGGHEAGAARPARRAR